MISASTQTRKEQPNATASCAAVRRCLVSGESLPKESMVRFALDPEGRVVPDIAERLPGRGLWVAARRDALETAVRKNLFSRAAKAKVRAEADLAGLVERLLRRRCLDLLGLARAAGAVVSREPAVLESLGRGALALILLAADAGGDIRKKAARAPALFFGFSREELGEALGREHLVAVGLKPHPLTDKMQAELARWQGVCAPSSEFQQTINGSSERP